VFSDVILNMLFFEYGKQAVHVQRMDKMIAYRQCNITEIYRKLLTAYDSAGDGHLKHNF